MGGDQISYAYIEYRRKMSKFDFNEHWGLDRVKCDHCNKVVSTYKQAKEHFAKHSSQRGKNNEIY